MQNTNGYGKIADNGYKGIVRRISEALNPSVTEGAPKVRKIKIIGLTGRSGSGKGYVCDRFLSFGIPSIDTDRVYRDITAADEVMRPCTAELCAAFGKQIVSADNSLDRKVLAEAVFTDSSKLALLNSITHNIFSEKSEHVYPRLKPPEYALSSSMLRCCLKAGSTESATSRSRSEPMRTKELRG